MATAEREILINFRASEDERAKLRALADAADEPYAMTLRRWIKQQYVARFGDVEPSKVRKVER
jgi:hypothetical protein